MAPLPGLLYVTMQPQETLSDAQFHDWYNNEHGPLRVRLPFCLNGFRYRATDLPPSGPSKTFPEWLAIYDITDMAEMNLPTYLSLRGPTIKTPREQETMAQIVVDRKLYDLVSETSSPSFRPIDSLILPPESTILIARSMTLKSDVSDAEAKFNAWYEEEHIPLLQKVPGWQRTRRYKTSSVLSGKEAIEFVALHEYTAKNGLGGPEFKAAVSTPWRDQVANELVETEARRKYELYYTFGPAPRELGALGSPDTKAWNSIDKMTFTHPAPWGVPAVESYVTTKDGVVLPYHLSGAASPNAPLIVLINSILVTHQIWDGFLSYFQSSPKGKEFRILRYNSRGRSSRFGDKDITMQVLASDTIALLDALRVEKAAAVIGVSVGGATTLDIALEYPDRAGAFVACDFNCNSSPGNVKAWEERISLAQSDSSVSSSGTERDVGEKLAEATVRRWFVPENYADPAISKNIEIVKKMVEMNSLEGFSKSVRALYEYDLRPGMKECQVPGLLVVGKGDGALPGAMEGMRAGFEKMSGIVKCEVISDAGHLPMVEKPAEFARIVEEFLGSI